MRCSRASIVDETRKADAAGVPASSPPAAFPPAAGNRVWEERCGIGREVERRWRTVVAADDAEERRRVQRLERDDVLRVFDRPFSSSTCGEARWECARVQTRCSGDAAAAAAALRRRRRRSPPIVGAGAIAAAGLTPTPLAADAARRPRWDASRTLGSRSRVLVQLLELFTCCCRSGRARAQLRISTVSHLGSW